MEEILHPKVYELYHGSWHNLQIELKIAELFILPMTDFAIDD